MQDWRALFQWLRTSGLTVSEIYEATVSAWRKKQVATPEARQMELLPQGDPRQLEMFRTA